MSDNGSPFAVSLPGVLTLFGKTLEELRGIFQSEVLDREIFRTLDAAGDGLTRFATYCS